MWSFKKIKELIDEFVQSELQEIEYRGWFLKLKIVKHADENSKNDKVDISAASVYIPEGPE